MLRSRPLVLTAASFFKVASRMLMPVKVWAMTSCSSRLILFRSSSCAERIWRDNRRNCSCKRSDCSQQLRVMMLAFLERRFRRLALGDFQAQFQVRGGQFHRALAQRLDEFFQLDGGLPRAAMRLLNRRDRHGKENSRLLDERGAFACRAARQHFRDQDLLVQLGQVQRLQSGGQRLTAQPARRLQARLPALLQMRSQRRPIAP